MAGAALLLGFTSACSFSRAPPPMMGGLTGLPRIPDRALRLTKPWNPTAEYSERIATLWRDLETLYGIEDVAGLGGSRSQQDNARYVDSGVKTNKFRGFTRNIDLREGEVRVSRTPPNPQPRRPTPQLTLLTTASAPPLLPGVQRVQEVPVSPGPQRQ